MIGRPSLQAAGSGAVVVGGTVQGSVTTNVELFGAVSIPLDVARLDPAQVYADSGVDAFVGREWLLEKLDAFLATRPCGYVWIEADAGLGKTAFAAWLVRHRGYLGHFSRQSSAGIAAAWQNLAAQLILHGDLAEQLAPGGMLPPWTLSGPGFAALVARAAPRDGGRLVLVIDGLDEIDSAGPGLLPLGLPETLPPGVFVIGTFRTGHRQGFPVSGSTTLTIAAEDDRNQRDLRGYLAAAVAGDVLAARLAEHGIPPAGFCAELAGRCGGVWVYLRYLLAEIRYGLRRPDDLADLPATVWDYYMRQLRCWAGSPDWPALSAVLAALAAAGEPVEAELLARFAGRDDAAGVRRCCDLWVRPFLTASPGSPRRYAIYHASFRQFLSGELGAARDGDHSDERRVVAEDMRAAVRRAHAAVADAYLVAFGGLPDLAALAADATLAGADRGYPLRHLASHLDRAGRVDDLHALLSCGTSVNVWFEAHDQAATLDLLLTDIERARRRAEAGDLAVQVRYALMAASVRTMTDNVGPALLSGLVECGLWDAGRALGHARRLRRPERRAPALAALGAVDEALGAVRGIADPYPRLGSLIELVPHVPEPGRAAVLTSAIEIARACPEPLRARALAKVARLLPAGDRGDLIEEALGTIASATGEHYQQALALAQLAPMLPAGSSAEAVRAAAAIVAGHELSGARALAWLAPHLPPEDLLAAQGIALGIADDNDRTRALAGILPHLAPGQRTVPLDEVLHALPKAMTHTYSRAEALADLAPALSPVQLDGALDIAEAVADEEARVRAIAGLAPHLSAGQLALVLGAANTLADRRGYGGLVAALAPYLTGEQHDQVLSRVPSLDDWARAELLEGLVPFVAPGRLDEALTHAAAITAPDIRAKVLTTMAGHVAAGRRRGVLRDALRAATTITDHSARVSAIAALTGNLPADLEVTAAVPVETRARIIPRLAAARQGPIIDDALAAAAREPAGYDRAAALAAIAGLLAGDRQRTTIDEALRESASDRRESMRAGVIERLAPYLSSDQAAAVLRDCAAVEHEESRAEMVAAVVPRLASADLPAALHIARRIHGRYARAVALTSLIPVLSGEQRAAVTARALRTCLALANQSDRAHRLAALVPHLDRADLPTVLRAAEAIEKPGERGRLLAVVATLLDPGRRPAVVAAARRAMAQDPSAAQRVTLLCLLLPFLPAGDRPAAVAEAVDLAVAADGLEASYYFAGPLRDLAAHLTGDQLARILTAQVSLGPDLVEPVLATLRHNGEPLTGPTGLNLLRLLLRCESRQGCLVIVAGLAGPLSEEAGPELTGALAAEVARVCAWWP